MRPVGLNVATSDIRFKMLKNCVRLISLDLVNQKANFKTKSKLTRKILNYAFKDDMFEAVDPIKYFCSVSDYLN